MKFFVDIAAPEQIKVARIKVPEIKVAAVKVAEIMAGVRRLLPR
ncbi:MAG: hypothetical protein ACREFV_09895 [Acetobacteraceae bacterium]